MRPAAAGGGPGVDGSVKCYTEAPGRRPNGGAAARRWPDSGSYTGPMPDPSRAAGSPGRVMAAGILAALAWLTGVAGQLVQAELPGTDRLLGGLVGAGILAVVALGLWRRGRWAGLAAGGTLVLAAAAAGWSTTGLRAADRLADRLPPELEGVDLVVTGVVVDLPQAGPNGLRLRVEPESAVRVADRDTPVTLPPRLAIGWYTGWHEDAALSAPQASLRAGQRWTFTLRLRRPHGNLNPHGFDHELQLFEQGIGATGYVRDGPVVPRRVADAVAAPVARWRQAVRDAILARVGDPRLGGVLAALAIGDQAAIEREDWALFRDTGIAHLMSISGLHVTMFAWLAGGLVGAAWRRGARAPLWLATPHAARWGGLAVATAYAVMAGWGVPAQRTVAMLAWVALLASLGRRWPWPMVLLAAAVLVTALDPWALLQPGFWLSFAAVGLLMASDPAQRVPVADPPPQRRWRAVLGRAGRVAREGLHSQWVATIGLTPLGLVFFQQVSVVGVLANLVAIPLVTLVVTPLALLGVVWGPLWSAGALVVQGMLAGLGVMAAWPGAVWTVPVAPPWAVAAGLLAAVVAVLPWPWRLRVLALPLVLPMLWPARILPAEGRFELLALDVGQGSAVLVRTRGHLLLFDAGPQYARDSDAGQRILLPLLRGRGERRIDRLVLSHRDQDHVGGARSVLGALPVGEILGSLEPGHPLHAHGVPVRRCEAGQRWVWDGVVFELLRPPGADYARTLKPNALSCVLRVAGTAPGSGAVLLTGDIEREQELALLGAGAAVLRSEVLIAPHHGSRTSSTAALLDAVAPRVAVFQAGYRNRFGHPAPDVIGRYRARGIATVETTGCGAWHWQGDAALASAMCERDRVRRHWHDRPPPTPGRPLPAPVLPDKP